MGKLGVGVGEDFPMDDGKLRDPERQAEFERAREEWLKQREEWHKYREEWRKRREEWHGKRRQWREEWRKHRDELRAEMREGFGAGNEHWHGYWHWDEGRTVVGLIAILGIIALSILILSHFTLFLGLLVLVGLWFAWRGGFDHYFDHRSPHTANGSPPADAPNA